LTCTSSTCRAGSGGSRAPCGRPTAPLLWGIGSFYDKFGFVVGLSGETFQVSRSQVARLEGPCRGRRPKRADAKAIARLFQADLAIRDGAMERPGRLWLTRAVRDKWMRVLEDDKGRLLAYYRAHPDGDALILNEVSLGRKPDEAAVVSVIADMAKVAKGCEKPNLRFELPPKHPLGQFCVADGCEIRRHIGHRGGGMVRIGNLDTLCARMAPEWERLLGESPVAGWTGRLRLKTDPSTSLRAGLGTVDLAIRRGKLRPELPKGRTSAIITADQSKVCRLVLGFHTPQAAARDIRRQIRRLDAPLPQP
jgi:hypothetical protein